MRSSRVLLGALGTAVVSVTLVAATTLPAEAAGPYVVKVGTKTSGTSDFTGTSTGSSPQIKFEDTTSGTQLGCSSGTASGAISLGNRPTGTAIAKITATTWTGCIGPAGIPLTVTQNGTWNLNATSAVTSTRSVAGSITKVSAFVSAANPAQCSFTVTGKVNGRLYQRPTSNQRLVVGGVNKSTLAISGVRGCFGLVNNGDKATFSATYKVTSPDGIIDVSNG